MATQSVDLVSCSASNFADSAKHTFNGEITDIPLSNFDARIVANIIVDDGVVSTLHFETDVTLLGKPPRRVLVPASKFNAMNWPVEELGSEAIIMPGTGMRDHARAAIQALSPHVIHRHVYAHTGWENIHNRWVYLHAVGLSVLKGCYLRLRHGWTNWPIMSFLLHLRSKVKDYARRSARPWNFLMWPLIASPCHCWRLPSARS